MTKTIKILFTLSVFFLPFGSKLGEIVGFINITYLYNILTFAAFNFLLIRDKFKVSLKLFPYPLTIFLLFTFVHILIVYTFFYPKYFFKPEIPGTDTPATNFLRYLISIQFMYVFISVVDYSFLRRLIKSFCWGYLFTFFIGFLAVQFKWIPVEKSLEGRFTGGFDNPNVFGVESTMILFTNLYLLLADKEKINKIKIFNVVFIIISLIGIFVSQSRMTFFGLILGLSIMFLLLQSLNKKLKYIVILGLFTVIFFLIVPKKIVEGVFVRISKHSITGHLGQKESRILIWSEYLSKAPTYAIQGVGFNRELTVNRNSFKTSINYVPHNMYLGVLVNYGIIGLLLFIFMTIRIYVIAKDNYRIQTLNNISHYSKVSFVALILIWILIYFNLGQYQNSRDYWLLLALMCSLNKI